VLKLKRMILIHLDKLQYLTQLLENNKISVQFKMITNGQNG